ncbi:hypothetical protein OfM1_12090 [Lactovum odontotermitis]
MFSGSLYFMSLVISLKMIFIPTMGQKQLSGKRTQSRCFAENFLIPGNEYLTFQRKSDYTREAILKFSNEMKIRPSIVLGRLQNDELMAYIGILN